MGREEGMRKRSKICLNLKWVEKQPKKVKILMMVLILGFCLLGLRYILQHIHGFQLFLASEIIHLSGIIILIFKLIKTKNCSGLSLKSQELTAIAMAARAYSSFELEDLEFTLLSSAVFLSTLLVIYMIRFKFNPTYSKQLDNVPHYFTVVPAAILALLIHPRSFQIKFFPKITWPFSFYLNSVTVLPQLFLMQNTKLVEPFTAYYVFALGVSRFVCCGSWIIHIYESGGEYLRFAGNWAQLWIPMAVLSEFVHTFILADFCYYYLKSVMYQQLLVGLSLPSSSLGLGKNI